jgi:integrase
MGVIVKQRPKGKGNPWWVYINHAGQRQAKKVGNKAKAEAIASKIRDRLAEGSFQIGHQKKVPTFGEYSRKYLDGYAATNLKFSTHQGYEIILRMHLQPLVDLQLDQITRTEIKDLIYAKLKDGLAPATVSRIKALISGILSHALEDNLISANPASRLGRHLKLKDKKADVNPLTREEARALLETVEKHYPRYYPFFLCALRTGMRLGELRGLEWGDIDFRGGFIEVHRAHVRSQVTTPKNRKSRRVDMSPQLAETLKELRTRRKREALTKGWAKMPRCVFINKAGHVLDEGNLRRRVFYPALAKAGMRHIRLHDLRHTYASMLIQNGESLADVRDQLGHSSIQVTVDIYGHLVPEANQQAVARLDDAVSDTYGKKPGCI